MVTNMTQLIYQPILTILMQDSWWYLWLYDSNIAHKILIFLKLSCMWKLGIFWHVRSDAYIHGARLLTMPWDFMGFSQICTSTSPYNTRRSHQFTSSSNTMTSFCSTNIPHQLFFSHQIQYWNIFKTILSSWNQYSIIYNGPTHMITVGDSWHSLKIIRANGKNARIIQMAIFGQFDSGNRVKGPELV